MLTAIRFSVGSKVVRYLTEHKEHSDTPPVLLFSLQYPSCCFISVFIVLSRFFCFVFYCNDLHVLFLFRSRHAHGWWELQEDKCVWALAVQPCPSVILNTVSVGRGDYLRGTGAHTWFGAVLYFLGPSRHLSPSLGASSLPSPLASWEEGTSGEGAFGFSSMWLIFFSLSSLSVRLHSRIHPIYACLPLGLFFMPQQQIISNIPQEVQNDLSEHPIFRL